MSPKSISTIFAALVLSCLFTLKVEAAPVPVTGWLWSENIGWISFSDANTNVTVDDATGALGGYGWSENIGWISFNFASGCPSGSCQPTVTFPSGTVSGWARVCAGMIEGGDVDTDTNNSCTGVSRTDGWDGWIELSGTNHPSPGTGVTANTGTAALTNYAWGSDVVGWTEFTSVTVNGGALCYGSVQPNSVICPNDGTGFSGFVARTLVDTCSAPAGSAPKCEYFCNTGYAKSGSTCVLAPVLNLQAAPISSASYLYPVSSPVAVGTQAHVRWNGANVVNCTASLGEGSWPGAKTVDGSWRTYDTGSLSLAGASTCGTAPATYSCYRFTLACQDLGGSAISRTVEVPLGTSQCAPYDNPAGSGAALSSFTVGVPMYWIVRPVPQTPPSGAPNYTFSWSGSDGLSGAGTNATCDGGVPCNYIRYVYKATGAKDAIVQVTDSGVSIPCDPAPLGSGINAGLNPSYNEF